MIESFNRFDEYQFAKYNTDSAVSLRDALFLVHPKAKDEAQQAIFDKIVSGNLAIPYTWETELSELGKQAFENEKAKAQAVSENGRNSCQAVKWVTWLYYETCGISSRKALIKHWT